MDVLSDVLGVVHSSGAVGGTATVAPRALGAVAFHLVLEGAFRLDATDATFDLSVGDLVLLPQRAAGECATRREAGAPVGGSFVPRRTARRAAIRMAEADATARVASGWLQGDHRMFRLVESLPPALIASARHGHCTVEWFAPRGRGGVVIDEPVATWFAATLQFAAGEAQSARPGQAAVVGRLAELLVLQVLREYLERVPPPDAWRTSLVDGPVSRAVHLLRSDPVRHWTVTELARTVAVSRTVLAERFVTLIGTTPMRYLAACRIRLAQQMLRQGTRSVQEIAALVGYDSDAAFNRAFKRVTGLAPGSWRRHAGPWPASRRSAGR